MRKIDILSLKLELADLLEKYDIVMFVECDDLYVIYGSISRIIGSEKISPKKLREL